MEKFFLNTKYWILNTLIFLFPLFFLPLTQEFFITNKLYLLAFAGLLLIVISAVELLVTKKIIWQKSSLDNILILMLVTIGLSTLISSPNKIQALLNPNYGLVMFVSLIIFYFYLSRSQINLGSTIYHLGSIILSLTTILFYFQPFKNLNFPAYFQFLKTPALSPIGNQLDLAIFLGFFIVFAITKFLKPSDYDVTKPSIFHYSFFIINLIALSLVLYPLLRPSGFAGKALSTPRSFSEVGPPFRLSWYAAVETLKNPLTALFGVGVDNFSAIFTRVKDINYNQSPLWQINSFAVSRSTLLHILTETGLFGLVAFGLLIFSLVKKLTMRNPIIYLSVYLFICLLFFPSSLVVWFLFFITISQLSNYELRLPAGEAGITDYQRNETDLSNLSPVYIGLALVLLIVVSVSSYFLGRAYLAELAFKKSADGLLSNNGKQVYDNQRQTIILNPFIERFRISFSQTNLLIANNIASKAGPQTAAVEERSGKTSEVKNELSEQDRQTIAQAVQAGINEAKASVALNPQKSSNWENLALIYRNILNVAKGADVWTISAFQRAIVLDPQNPRYRLILGGVYYSLANYDEAVKLFEQAVILKPDWPNAYYNLAWSYYQKTNYQQAASAMENVLKLLNPATDQADFEKANKELEQFKAKIPKEAEKPTEDQPTQQLTLPTPPAEIEPKIELPEAASPEAQ